MRLDTLMKAEIKTINVQVGHIIQKVDPFIGGTKYISFETKELFDASIRELTTYKVRLENLLCETDKKEQAHL